MFVSCSSIQMDRTHYLLQFLIRIRRTYEFEYLAGFVDPVLGNQPSRANGDSKEQRKEDYCRDGRYSKLVMP